MEKLTEDDLHYLQYFHKQVGDITSWSDWEEKKALVKAEFPEIVHAIEMKQTAERILNVAIKAIWDNR